MKIFSRKERGERAERIAEKFLKKRGLRLAARNLRNRAGELDLLMWDGDVLVIVEVRSVRALEQFDIADKIPPSKRRQVVRLARNLMRTLPEPLPEVRFDAVVVEFEPELLVHHLPDAFRARDYPLR